MNDALAPRMWQLARVLGLNREEALATCQLASLRLRQRLPNADVEGSSAFLFRAVHEESLRLARSAQRPMDPSPRRAPAPIDLRDATSPLWQLSARGRELLVLLGGDRPLTYREVSFALDMPMGSIGPTRSRVVDALRAHSGHDEIDVASIVARELMTSDPPPAIGELVPDGAPSVGSRLAELVHDSDDVVNLTANPQNRTNRTLQFAAPDLAIEVLVRERRGAREVFSRTSAPAVVVGAEAYAAAGRLGALHRGAQPGFELLDGPAGPLLIRVALESNTTVDTEWVCI